MKPIIILLTILCLGRAYRKHRQPQSDLEGTYAIKNVNQVDRQDNLNLVAKMTQNNFINHFHETRVHNYFVYDKVEYSIYSGGRLLRGKDLLKLNLDKDCDVMFH